MSLPIPGRVADIVRQSTVHVRTGTKSSAQSSGSGVVLSREQIMTNAHVLQGGEIQVETWEGVLLSGKVLKLDRGRDLALVAVPGLRNAPLPLGDSDKARVGTPVLAIGNPMGFVGAVSSGVIHSTVKRGSVKRWLCADLRLAPGNSGGPLADFSGQVLGINTLVAAGGLAYAIPSRSVQRFLVNGPHHQLGVVIRPVEFRPGRFGLLVLGIVPGSGAEQASLMTGDILAGANGIHFGHADDLSVALEEARDGILHVDFYRGNHDQLRHVSVKLLVADKKRTAAA